MSKPADPRGREATMAALVSAFERLCSTTPPNLVSVRDVAAEAHVTLGLVHHYFESKDALTAATLRAIAGEVDEVAASVYDATADPAEMTRAVWLVFEKRPAFAYIVSWWLLEGRNVTEAMGEHPFMARLAKALHEAGHEDGPTQAAAIAAMIVAGTAFKAGFNVALSRPPDDPVLTRRLEQALEDLARAT